MEVTLPMIQAVWAQKTTADSDAGVFSNGRFAHDAFVRLQALDLGAWLVRDVSCSHPPAAGKPVLRRACWLPKAEMHLAGFVDQHRSDYPYRFCRPREQFSARDQEISPGESREFF